MEIYGDTAAILSDTWRLIGDNDPGNRARPPSAVTARKLDMHMVRPTMVYGDPSRSWGVQKADIFGDFLDFLIFLGPPSGHPLNPLWTPSGPRTASRPLTGSPARGIYSFFQFFEFLKC